MTEGGTVNSGVREVLCVQGMFEQRELTEVKK